MKSLIITLSIITKLAFMLEAQPISNDTVVCIIDTTKCYVKYKENPFADRDPKFHWQVSIKGHYYDIIQPADKDFACVVFDADDLSSIYHDYKGPFRIRMQKEKIKNRFVVVTEEWVNQQTNYGVLGNKIGYSPSSKYNFIVFKQDFDNLKSDSVTMHRVLVGYNEIVE